MKWFYNFQCNTDNVSLNEPSVHNPRSICLWPVSNIFNKWPIEAIKVIATINRMFLFDSKYQNVFRCTPQCHRLYHNRCNTVFDDDQCVHRSHVHVCTVHEFYGIQEDIEFGGGQGVLLQQILLCSQCSVCWHSVHDNVRILTRITL